jgi:DNA mismatch endonuclease, patch repair protein
MDKLNAEQRSANMRRIRSEDTAPEKFLRHFLHRQGYRFRLHRKDLPGRPDLVFPSRKKVIFVHGCFWHQHRECREGRVPESRREYWGSKLLRNRQRDAIVLVELAKGGWQTFVVWECELSRDPSHVLQKVRRFLDKGYRPLR